MILINRENFLKDRLMPHSQALKPLLMENVEHVKLNEIPEYLVDLVNYQADGKLPQKLKSLDLKFSFNWSRSVAKQIWMTQASMTRE